MHSFRTSTFVAKATAIGLALALLSATVATSELGAQTQRWPSVHQTNGWYGNIFETALSPRLALLTEVSWRRMGLINQPKQLFAIAGLGLRVLPGVRATIGGGYTASSPYGALPSPYPNREYNIWYQLQLVQHAGTFDVGHRFRLENRWTHDVISDGGTTRSGDTRYSRRFEYQLKATHPFKSLPFRKRPIVGFAADEIFFGLAPAERGISVDQNRVLAGLGLPLSASERLEIGYMQQWIANTRYKTSEFNGTLQIVFVHSLPIR